MTDRAENAVAQITQIATDGTGGLWALRDDGTLWRLTTHGVWSEQSTDPADNDQQKVRRVTSIRG